MNKTFSFTFYIKHNLFFSDIILMPSHGTHIMQKIKLAINFTYKYIWKFLSKWNQSVHQKDKP